MNPDFADALPRGIPPSNPAGAAVEPVFLESAPPVPPGVWQRPGLLEAGCWVLGLLGLHFVAGFAGMVVILLIFVVNSPHLLDQLPPPGSHRAAEVWFHRVAAEGMAFVNQNMALVLAFGAVATVLYALVAVRVRGGRSGLRQLGWRIPYWDHLLFLVLLVPPLSLLSSELQKEVFRLIPGARTELENILGGLRDLPLGLLLLILAAAPALGEELLFRGVIGRGLISRHGLLRGMLLTSVLFGVTHINPAQALGVIPLGMAMHFAYVTTRSFWAPLLLHFLNNALAAFMLKHGQQLAMARLVDDARPMPLPLVVVSAAMAAGLCLLLWQTRARFHAGDGRPCVLSERVGSPVGPGVVIMRPRARRLLLANSTVSIAGFVILLWSLS